MAVSIRPAIFRKIDPRFTFIIITPDLIITTVCSTDTLTFPDNERSNGVKLFSVCGKIQDEDDGFICSEVLVSHRRLQ